MQQQQQASKNKHENSKYEKFHKKNNITLTLSTEKIFELFFFLLKMETSCIMHEFDKKIE